MTNCQALRNTLISNSLIVVTVQSVRRTMRNRRGRRISRALFVIFIRTLQWSLSQKRSRNNLRKERASQFGELKEGFEPITTA